MQLFDVTNPIVAAMPAVVFTGFLLAILLNFYKGSISESSVWTKLVILTLMAFGVGITLFISFINIYVVIGACIAYVPVVVLVNEYWKKEEKIWKELEREVQDSVQSG